MTSEFPRGTTEVPVGGSEETVMNPTVPDMARYNLKYEGTVWVNGAVESYLEEVKSEPAVYPPQDLMMKLHFTPYSKEVVKAVKKIRPEVLGLDV